MMSGHCERVCQKRETYHVIVLLVHIIVVVESDIWKGKRKAKRSLGAEVWRTRKNSQLRAKEMSQWHSVVGDQCLEDDWDDTILPSIGCCQTQMMQSGRTMLRG